MVFDITRIDNIVNNNLFRFCTKELSSYFLSSYYSMLMYNYLTVSYTEIIGTFLHVYLHRIWWIILYERILLDENLIA